MRSLGTIKPKTGKKIYNPNADTWVSQLFEDCIDSGYTHKHGRSPALRPSSFPSCSVMNLMQFNKSDPAGHVMERKEFRMEYYTTVGTIVHEVSQLFMGISGVQYGHWKCTNRHCKHGKAAMDIKTANGEMVKEGKLTREFTTKNKCPKCKIPMFYIELEVVWGEGDKQICGHIDGVWKIPKHMGGGYWIIDYKTSSMKKIEAGEYPEKKHMYQLPIYAYILKEKYGMDVKGFSLIYIPRDNPHNFFEARETWSKKWDDWSLKVIKENSKGFAAVQKDRKAGTVIHSIAAKPCKSESNYFNKMHDGFEECPMLDVCFSDRHLKKRMEKWQKLNLNEDRPTGIFKEAIKVLTHKQHQGLGIKKIEPKAFQKPKPKHISI